MQALGRDERETILQVKTQLLAERRNGAGPGTVAFANAVVTDICKKFQVLFHACLDVGWMVRRMK
jgi:hypothetical protein